MNQPFLGSIQYFAFDFAPTGWQMCNGQALQISTNQALFSLLGTQFGGNGTTTFNLPDYRGRIITGGLQGQIGIAAGTESATLSATAMPAHIHGGSVQFAANNTNTRGSSSPVNAYPAEPSARSGNLYAATPGNNEYLGAPSVTVGNAGTGLPFSIINPYLALTCCIAIQGIYPSRN